MVASTPNQRAIDESLLPNLTDIYLPAKPIDGSEMTSPGASAFVYEGTPEAMFLRDTALHGWADRLAMYVRMLATKTTESDFPVVFEGQRYRARRNQMAEGEQFNLRVTATRAPSLEELKFKNPLWPQIFLSPQLLSGGLIVFAAEMGQGKTTTAAAVVHSRLKRYAGYGQTVENPAEVPLDGVFGRGICRQTSVSWDHPDPKERGWEGAMRAALRSYPTTSRGNLMFIGEIRDSEVAAEALQAAANGLLVITTVHALNIASAMQRLVSYADIKLEGMASELLASSLRLAVQQRLVIDRTQSGWNRGILDGQLLYCDGYNHPAAQSIRRREFSKIQQPLKLQENVMNNLKGRAIPIDDVMSQMVRGTQNDGA